MSDVATYVHELADRIGPRPATTDTEAEAAEYLQGVMRAKGLEVERQDFDCPRTYTWSFVIYHVLTITAAVASGWAMLVWPALILSAATAIIMRNDLDTKWGLTSLMPKGPSQNVVGRRSPRTLRGERPRKIVLVAHYDSARASLAFSPGMVRSFEISFRLMKWITYLVPVLILIAALPWTQAAFPYLWYATMVISMYLLIPLLINVHREFFMHPTDGANDNASGVAAMLGVLDIVVPDEVVEALGATQPITRGPEAAAQQDVVPEGAVLSYSPAETPAQDPTKLPDDFEWAETGEPARGQSSLEFDTVEFDAVGPGSGLSESRSAAPDLAAFDAEGADSTPGQTGGFGAVSGPGTTGGLDLGADDAFADEPAPASGFDAGPASSGVDEEALFGTPDQQAAYATDSPQEPKRGLRGLWSRSRKKRGEEESAAGWLGVGDGFDAREEGRDIGSWENFDEEEDDGMGFKGGWAGDDPIGDQDFASNEAARIRKRVTESLDHSFDDKEIWWVATGAEEVGTFGMRSFLEEYADELRGALIINFDNLGAGTLHWVTEEGMARRYKADRRLITAAKTVAREQQMVVKGRAYKGLSTDATPAMARKYKSISLMAFDVNGRLPNWHWTTDTSNNVEAENLSSAAELAAGMIRQL
jgi:hypothetical protein